MDHHSGCRINYWLLSRHSLDHSTTCFLQHHTHIDVHTVKYLVVVVVEVVVLLGSSNST